MIWVAQVFCYNFSGLYMIHRFCLRVRVNDYVCHYLPVFMATRTSNFICTQKRSLILLPPLQTEHVIKSRHWPINCPAIFLYVQGFGCWWIIKKENYTSAQKYEFYRVLVVRTVPNDHSISGLTRVILPLPLEHKSSYHLATMWYSLSYQESSVADRKLITTLLDFCVHFELLIAENNRQGFYFSFFTKCTEYYGIHNNFLSMRKALVNYNDVKNLSFLTHQSYQQLKIFLHSLRCIHNSVLPFGIFRWI